MGPDNIICREWVRKARSWLPGGGFVVEFMHGSGVFTSGVIFLQWDWIPPFRLHIFSFILAFVHFPSSSCRVDLSKTDTCPISPRPKSLGVVDKAKEYGSVRCKALYGKDSKGSLS